MSLLQTPGQIGQMLRVTDSLGGCISYAKTTIGTDTRWRGPKFSITFRYKLINAGGTGRCMTGVSNVNGNLRRFWLEVEATAGNLIVRGQINSTDCGAVTVFTNSGAKDTNEHSVAWTYDQAGSYVAYRDGAQVASGSSPCADVNGPADTDDVFGIFGSYTPGLEIFYVDEVGFQNDILTPSQVSQIHTSGVTP